MIYAETVLKSSKKIQLNLGGLNLCNLGSAFGAPPPLEKTLENRYRVEMHVT